MPSSTFFNNPLKHGFASHTKQKPRQSVPPFVDDFCSALSGQSSTTRAYRRDLCFFLSYLTDVIPSLEDTALPDFPLQVFTLLDREDVQNYVTFLKEARFMSNASVYAKLAAIKAFYKYLFGIQYTFNNPFKDLKADLPRRTPDKVLSPAQIRVLLSDMDQNNGYLTKTADGEYVTVPIDELPRIRREPVVLRNKAIISLFLFCGLSLQEVHDLNINDVSLINKTIVIHNAESDKELIRFSGPVEDVLAEYLQGRPLPSALTDKYLVPGAAEFDWCRNMTRNVYFEKRLLADFPGRDDTFYRDMKQLASAMRKQGREGLKPKKNEKALFVSFRGQRMSSIMIQKMVREMLMTYLGTDEKNSDVSLLRRTCAAYVLAGSEDAKSAARYMNRKTVKGICREMREK